MARKGENIRKRKDGRWEGRYEKGRRQNNSIIYGSVYGKTYREAKVKLQTLKVQFANHNLVVHKNIQFGEVLSLWLENNRIKNKGATETKYQNMIETHILPELGDIKMSHLTAPLINTFLLKKLENGRLDGQGGLAESYINTMSLIIDSSIKFAVDEKMCEPLCSKIFKPKIPKGKIEVMSIQNKQVLEKYLRVNLDCTNLGILISLHAGLRIGEVCALTWEDIDFKSKLIHVQHTISRVRSKTPDKAKYEYIIETPKTEASVRDIPLTPYLLSALKFLKQVSIAPYVISSNNNFVNPRTYENRYKKILKECEIQPFYYHTLRHTFATRCIEAGMDIKSLSEILGHSDIAFTLKKYVHPSMELKRRQIEKMAQLAS